MIRIKWLLALTSYIAIFGCARSSGTNAVEISGFNERGEHHTTKAIARGETCAASSQAGANYFAARCEDAGYTVLATADCSFLCSGPLEL